MAPRLAKSLVTLRDQVNTKFPTRSIKSDGWIGDAAHAARESQHNPNDWDVVCALDITEDLSVGLDCMVLMDQIDALNDPRVFYEIHQGQIDNSDDSRTKYNGPNRHDTHFHLSVRYNVPALFDDPRPWNIPLLSSGPVIVKPAPRPPTSTVPAAGRTLRLSDPLMRGNDVAALQNELRNAYPAYRHTVSVQRGSLITVDGIFGRQCDAWVREFQKRWKLKVDGVVGPATKAKLRSL